MISQKDRYFAAFRIKYGDRPDFYFLMGVLGQVLSEHDPDCELPEPELLEIFYQRVKTLGVEVLD